MARRRTGASAKPDLPLQLLQVDLDDVDLPCCKLVDEVRPRETGDLGGPVLGDHAAPVPFDGNREAYVLLSLIERLMKGGEDSFRQIDGQGRHGLPPKAFCHAANLRAIPSPGNTDARRSPEIA